MNSTLNGSIEGRGNPSDDSESSSSEAEDEDALELTEEVEKNFFKALNSLKKKDPQIYEKETRFFGTKPELDEEFVREKRKKKSEAPLNVRKYETSMLLNKTTDLSDENDAAKENDVEKGERGLTYVQELDQLKDSFKKVLNEDSSDEDEPQIGGLFHEHKKSKKEVEDEEAEYKKWLKGQKNQIDDYDTKNDLEYLHDYWNDPNLDDGEKFLRDYILNRKFLDESKPSSTPVDLLTLEEDEKVLTEQTDFEHKYNFRFEEPDREFIKRYPRTMENSMRRKDDRRKKKRQETLKRKKEEKERKKLELRKIKELKFEEIKEKIAKLKDITGNPELGFQDEDIEKDFDPDEHNLKMQKLFSDEFYNQEELEKPVFDDEGDLNLDSYGDDGYNAGEIHCEDPDFIMDCDYDPEQAKLEKKKKLEAREKKKKKIKTEVADNADDLNIDQNALDESIQKDLEDIYQYDCEDIIGDTPIRFKYRQVVPNDFGLTVDEILAADDKELEKWCSINRISQVRPEEMELYDVKAFKRKADNEDLKKKILPSLFKSEKEKKAKKKRNKKKKTTNSDSTLLSDVPGCSTEVAASDVEEKNSSKGITVEKPKKKESKKRKMEQLEDTIANSEENILNGEENSPEMNGGNEEFISSGKIESAKGYGEGAQKKKKRKVADSNPHERNKDVQSINKIEEQANLKKKKKHSASNSGEMKKTSQSKVRNNKFLKGSQNKNTLFGKTKFNPIKNKKSNKNKPHRTSNYNNTSNEDGAKNKPAFYCEISDSRLKAYGIKPKAFKNKLKYGKNTDG